MTDCSLQYKIINNDHVLIGDNSSHIGNAYLNPQCCPSNVIIPRYINGLPVLELGQQCFRDLQNIKQLIIISHLTHLHFNCIRNNENLKEIILPPTIEFIGSLCFYDISLAKIIFPLGTNLKFMDEFVFLHPAVNSVTIYFCSYVDFESKESQLNSNLLNVYVPPGGVSKFANLNTQVKNDICKIDDLAQFFPNLKTIYINSFRFSFSQLIYIFILI